MGAVVGDLGYLSLFLLAGLALRELVTPLQKLFLPAGLIGGVLALVMGPQVLGWIEIPKTFGGMAGPMIDIVFNPGFVMDPLRAIDEDEIIIELSNGHSPALIKCSVPFLYVMMPLRIS